MIDIPLSAIINDERIIGPDLSDDAWNELKLQHKNGLPIIMTCCGLSGHLRKSKNGLKHFYHSNKSEECGGEPETLEHLKLKYQIYQICKSEGWTAQPEYQSLSGDWRADVYATKENRNVVFEVQLSSIPQEDLQAREGKYARDGIESYWILKDYLGIHPYDDPNDPNDEDGVFLDTYINEVEFFLQREQLYHIEKGIRTIGLDLKNLTLYTTEKKSIDLSEWVKNTLNGDYSRYLTEQKIKHTDKIKLREYALPALEELNDFEQKFYGYQHEIKKLYAIFKNNTWEDHLSLKDEIHSMYDSFKTFKDTLWKIFSPKNGFLWKTYPYTERKYRQLNFISEQQIGSIYDQIANLKIEETKFLSIFNVVKGILEEKDGTVQAYYKNSIEEKDPGHYKNKKLYRKQQAVNDTPVGTSPENKPQQNTTVHAPKRNDKIIFAFSQVLPLSWIISQKGMKYQNPAGCAWEIDKEDAIEFEKKGFGKILKLE